MKVTTSVFSIVEPHAAGVISMGIIQPVGVVS
jgi:hypothetical protein